MFQDLTLVGQLGRDPVLKYLDSGKAVCNFSIAVDEFGGKTTWFNVTTWDKTAENCNQFLSKGRLVLVKGRLRAEKPRVYTRSDGTADASYEVTAFTVTFLGHNTGAAVDHVAEANRDLYGDEPASVQDDEIPF